MMETAKSKYKRSNHPKEVIFLNREYNSVKGKKNGVLIMLTAILFFSLFSVVLGKAGLDYLNVRMNDPYIKWFSISVSNQTFREKYTEIKKFFDNSVETNAYSISKSSGAYRGLWRFFPKNGGGTTVAFAQSFNFWKDSALVKSICSDENLVQAYVNLDSLTPELFMDGVIISSNLLKDLECEPADLVGNKIMIQNGDYLPLNVLAVVRSLPNKAHAFAENSLVFTLNNYDHSNASGSSSAMQKELSLYVLSQSDDEQKRIEEEISKILNEEKGIEFEKVIFEDSGIGLSSQNKKITFQGLSRGISFEAAKRLTSEINEKLYQNNPALVVDHSLLIPYKNRVYGNPENRVGSDDDKFDILSFKIEDLTQIAAFQKVVLEKFAMELDLSQVEAKQNFGVVSIMSSFLILSLVFFAGFAILIYLFNLMKGHLEKISVNLGTLLAFGLPREFLYNGYLKIIFKLIIRATLIALTLLVVLIFLFRLSNSAIPGSPDFLNNMKVLSNAWVWATILIFFIISFFLFRSLLRSFLSCSPGDLIYNRL